MARSPSSSRSRIPRSQTGESTPTRSTRAPTCWSARCWTRSRPTRRLDRARGLPGAGRRRPLRAPPGGLLDRHRDARPLPAGQLGHPRGPGRDRRRPAAGRPGPPGRGGRRGQRRRRAGVARAARHRRRGRRRREDRPARGPRRRDRDRRGRERPGLGAACRTARVGAGARLREAILAAGAEIAPGAEPEPGAVVGEGERVGCRVSRAPTARASATRSWRSPDHLRDALWRIESARLRPMEAPAAFVCGMGGSAIGGDLAAAALGDRLSKPFLTVRGYELPSWAPAGSAVLCSSYSGETEETLACYAAAEALGAQRLVATTGGQLADAARARRRARRRPARPAAAAARRGRLHVLRRRRAGRAGAGGPAHRHRDRRRRRPPGAGAPTRWRIGRPSSPSRSATPSPSSTARI